MHTSHTSKSVHECRGRGALGALPRLFALLLLVALLALVGCDNGGQDGDKTASATDQLDVVATTNIIGETVRRISGERIDLEVLMGPGVDPHLYKASQGDLMAMSEADLIFYNGLDLEGKMTSVFEKMRERGTPTVALAESVPEKHLIRAEDYESLRDPHVWMDVELWKYPVKKIRETLAEHDSKNADFYKQRTDEFLKEMTELDQWVEKRTHEVPEDKRVLITAHDAFSYFGQGYGFQVKGLQGISTASEAGTQDVQNLADFITEREIPAMFIESSVPRRNIQAVQKAVSSRGFQVSIGGELFSDALGSSGTPEGTYPGMIRHNINTIVSALKGNPEDE